MKIVGYTEGVDSLFLTQLSCRGYGTLPLSNGVDDHGKFIKLLTKSDDVALVITYFHKILGVPTYNITCEDLLYSCKSLNIPALIIVPTEHFEKARAILCGLGDHITLVDPDDLLEKALKLLWL